MNRLLKDHYEEIRQANIRMIMDDIVISQGDIPNYNGITFGVPMRPIIITHPDYNIRIEIGHLNTQTKNLELAKELFKKAIESYVK